MNRISEPQISPDGKWVAYRVAAPDKAANRAPGNIWIAPVASGDPRQLTRSGRDSRPQWSPDGRRIAFLSSRDGTPQIYLISLEGGEATRLTSLSTGADNVTWSPDGKWLSFTSDVYPDCKDDACNEKRDTEAEKSKVKARVYDALLYRHWDAWEDGKRSHLFVVSAEGGTPRDLTPGWSYDVPPGQRGGADDIAWSPDSKELCFVAVTDPVEAISTNGDLFTVPSAGGAEPKRITTNQGFDGLPAYSPDGKWIAYHAQLRAGFEADKWRLMLYDRQSGKHTNVNEGFDRSVEDPVWTPDSKSIYFMAENTGQRPIYRVSAAPGAEPKIIVADTFNAGLSLSSDGRTLAFQRMSMAAPYEVYAAGTDGSGARQITRHNADKLAVLDLSPAEHFWFDGAGGAKVHGMLLRPPAFDASKKYPVVMVLHGGPQTQFSDAWSYRWNPQMFAAPGYVVVCINRRGSTGFGQKFTDEVSQDYGGKAYEDLMKGLDYVLAKYPFADGTRVAAAGGSYGGFMANWMATHTGRFKAIITHASIFDQVSMYGGTEELWFMEWDGGGPFWANPEGYRKGSPSSYAAELGKYKTPTLVIHGEQDYRVPYTQGLQMFTALQRQGVPSRLVIYPDEGHWILKPQNSELWYREVLGWLKKYL